MSDGKALCGRFHITGLAEEADGANKNDEASRPMVSLNKSAKGLHQPLPLLLVGVKPRWS